jgi:hypothetical protein
MAKESDNGRKGRTGEEGRKGKRGKAERNKECKAANERTRRRHGSVQMQLEFQQRLRE